MILDFLDAVFTPLMKWLDRLWEKTEQEKNDPLDKSKALGTESDAKKVRKKKTN